MSAASVALRQPANRAVGTTHPQYGLYAPVWEKLAQCYEGSGGFLDGTFLVAHPREWEDYTATTPKKPTKKLKARRAIARYENVAGTILDQLKSALFRESVTRTIGKDEDSTQKHPLSAWWRNVDGKGCSIDDYMATRWTACGLYGHLAHMMELPKTSEAPLTQADAGEPFLCAYTPLDVADWRIDDYGAITAVKLIEVEPQTDIEAAANEDRIRVRYVTRDGWKLVSYQGQDIDKGPHSFGRLPVVFHYAKRRALSTVLGQSVLNDPQLYIDLFNLTSELRELLRNQTFSILNVVLGTGPDAISPEKAVDLIKAAGGVGTENVLLSAAASGFITADATNVEAYQKEREQLLRTIYRLAGVPWESDSKDAEATGSLKLKREDMNQVLASYADECEKAEYQFVELWFRHKHGDRWQQELETAQVVIRYPDTFDVTPFAELLEEAQAAVALDLPPTAMKEIRRRVIAKFLPDVTPSVLEAIGKELDELAVNEPKQRAAELKAALVKASGGAYGAQPGAQDGAAAV
jgi:hypothetical protein